jgi:hypothetical protein
MTRQLQIYRVRFFGRAGVLDEFEIAAADTDAALRAADEIQGPPRSIGFRLIDCEGREISGRSEADRR